MKNTTQVRMLPARLQARLKSGGWCGVGLVFLLCGCSSFNSEWRRAAELPNPPNSIEGRWQGTWRSDVNAHTGKLRCLITLETNDCYTASFHAVYMKVLNFHYSVPLVVEAADQKWRFSGMIDLGLAAGGMYRYLGEASATNFQSTYDSDFDHGVFEMRRPAD